MLNWINNFMLLTQLGNDDKQKYLLKLIKSGKVKILNWPVLYCPWPINRKWFDNEKLKMWNTSQIRDRIFNATVGNRCDEGIIRCESHDFIIHLNITLRKVEFEDTKVIRSGKSKDKQYNGQNKKDKGQTIQWPK